MRTAVDEISDEAFKDIVSANRELYRLRQLVKDHPDTRLVERVDQMRNDVLALQTRLRNFANEYHVSIY